MDPLSIAIIVIATALAIIFKWVIMHKIRRWMDADLITGLSNNDLCKRQFLEAKLKELQEQGVRRKYQHQKLTDFSNQYEPSHNNRV